MKPLKLTIQAFGPFADEETIDFTQVERDGVFLLTGPTGSGKTCIFDAISFALYDRPSGDKRENYSLKSHYCDSDAICSVRFRFEAGGHIYDVRRTPKQEKFSSRTKTIRLVQETVELDIDDTKTISGNSQVNSRIHDALGLDRDQFRQIVMLAQGDFMRLLQANSSDKERIFRKIFRTERLNDFTENLKNMARDVKEQLDATKSIYLSAIRNIDPGPHLPLSSEKEKESPEIDEVLHCLEQAVGSDQKELDTLNQQSQEFEQKLLELNLPGIEEIRQKFIYKVQLEQKRNTILQKEPEIQKLESLIEQIGKSQQIRIQEIALQKGQDLLYSLIHKQKKLQEQAEVLQKQFQQIDKELEKVPKYKKDVVCLQEEAAKLSELQEKFLGIQEKEKTISILQEKQQKAQKSVDLIKLLLERAKKQKEQSAMLKSLEMCDKSLSLRQKYLDLTRSFMQVDTAYRRAHQQLLDSQAGLLALSLREGIPCPVCGSKEHPQPATPPTSDIQQEAVEKLQKNREEILKESKQKETLLLNVLQDFQSAEVEIEFKHFLQNPEFIVQNVRELHLKIDTISADSRVLDMNIARYIVLQKVSAEKYRDFDYLAEQKSKLEGEVHEISGKLETLQISLAEIKEALYGYSSQDECEERALLINKEIDTISETIENIAHNHTLYQSKIQNIELQLDAIEEEILHSTEERERLTWEFEIALRNGGFSSTEVYQSVYAKLSRLTEMKKYLEEEQKEATETKAKYNLLCEQLENVKLLDLDEKQRKGQRLYKMKEELKEKRDVLVSRISVNRKQQKAIGSIADLIKKLDLQYRDIGSLAQTAGGNNEHKLTFERYVLGRHFDGIIRAANLHLERMTQGRYQLLRRENRSSYISTTGLDIDVMDAYTGRTRHVNTLSGGESFKASLSLALGLADIVAQYSGGIQLGTIFIDEGFGTLDPQSLESAMETLLSLRNDGRLVGIISHVPELYQIISSKIIVTPSQAGSRITVVS